MIKIKEKNYFVWNEYAVKDLEMGPIVGKWEVFNNFRKFERFIKDTCINNALLSIYSFEGLEDDASIFQRISYLYENSNDEISEVINEVAEFVFSDSKNYNDLNKSLYKIICLLKSQKEHCFNIYIFDSIYSAMSIVNEHYHRNNGDFNDQYNQCYRDMIKALENDEA